MKVTARVLVCFVLLSFSLEAALAGGPARVAGTIGFNSGLAGTPITWAGGQITYYTDLGNLSPLLPGAAADAFVADAFSRWTSVPTAALAATRAGQLAEDVNGTNVGSGYFPSDIMSDSSKPVAIVYDADGAVINALLGAGAGGSDMCSTNAVYAEIDKVMPDAHAAHALVVIDGQCAQFPSDLPILKFQLIRALGRIIGLDYSQLNENVAMGTLPYPTLDDYAGYPLMAPIPALCNEGVGCQSGADQLRMDDQAALSRLYPVTAENIGNFAGKQLFYETTGRITGSVRFASWRNLAGQGMQGVNVVARLVDPITSRVSRRVAASSVSGFLFSGDVGNPITGYASDRGDLLESNGSNDAALEGYFDLAGLQIPAGFNSATYELSVEPVNPLYIDSVSVGPYKTGQVSPSGTAPTMRVTVSAGGHVSRDIVMTGGTAEAFDRFEPNDFNSAVAVPGAGAWTASLSGYGDFDAVTFHASPDRTFTLDVTALDDSGAATTSKAEPVVGVWMKGDPESVPRIVGRLFNSTATGTTRVQGGTTQSGDLIVGIADDRGDGRPDFRYSARLLYVDSVTPSRASAQGGTALTISGLGFSSNVQMQIGSMQVPVTVLNGNTMIFTAPPLSDATYNITLTDPATGATSEMDNVLHVGGADAKIQLVLGSNPQVPVGTQAPNPMRVRVVDAYDGSPVAGAAVTFSAPATVSIVGCSASPCVMFTDQNGDASASVLVKAAGATVITASIWTGSSVATTVNGINSSLEIGIPNPTVYVAAGANTSVPLWAMVVANGLPAANQGVNFFLNSGTATINPVSTITGPDGSASTQVSVTGISGDVNISACVAPANAPCRTFIIHSVAASALELEHISGDAQTVAVGQGFSPVVLRVVDSSAAPNSVIGAAVRFHVSVYQTPPENSQTGDGETIGSTDQQPVIISSQDATVSSDANGLAKLPLSVPMQGEPVTVTVQAFTGTAELDSNLATNWLPTSQPGSARSGYVAPIIRRPAAGPRVQSGKTSNEKGTPARSPLRTIAPL